MFRLKALKYICLLLFAGMVIADVEASDMDAIVQEARLSVPGDVPNARPNFGYSVAVSGNTTVIGASGDDYNTGAAYVYTNTGGIWTETKLTADDGEVYDYFGWSVAIDGNTIVVGANGDDDNGSSSGSVYVFSNAGGTWMQTAKLTADDGERFDNFGYSVAIDGNTIVVGANGDDDNGSGSGSVYVFEVDWQWKQTAKLTPSDGVRWDEFGRSVSIDGNTIVVGVPYDDDKGSGSGSAYVFSNAGGAWAQSAKLTADDGESSNYFGWSVAIDGNTIVAGAWGNDVPDETNAGSAYVFSHADGSWTQSAKLTADDGAEGDLFGTSVAIDGNTIVAGARGDDVHDERNAGSAYVFSHDGGAWNQVAKMTADKLTNGIGYTAYDQLGYSVSIDGNTIVTGAYGHDAKGRDSGGAYLFIKPNTGWRDGTHDAILSASDGVASVSKTVFGSSVSIDGNTAVVGAYGEALYTGAVYVFRHDGGVWTQSARLTADDGESYDYFGYSVSIDGNTIVAGAYGDDDNGSSSGSAYVFSRDGGVWTQSAKLTADDGERLDRFGRSVSIDGNTIVAGAFGDDDNGSSSGSAYVFSNTGGTWMQSAKLTANDGERFDYFGDSVTIDGNTIVIGAYYDDDNGSSSGSAYVFSHAGGTWMQSAKLTADDGTRWALFGVSVSVDGNTIVVGASEDPENGDRSGSVYVFSQENGTWAQVGKLTALDGDPIGNRFGSSVSLDGNTLAVGARTAGEGQLAASGAVYVFSNTSGMWRQVAKAISDDRAYDDQLGRSVSVSNNTVLAGTSVDAWDSRERQGAAYIFRVQVPEVPRGTLQSADVNGNGVIDTADFVVFIAAFGTADSRFDFDGNGIVDAADYEVFVENFGQPVF